MDNQPVVQINNPINNPTQPIPPPPTKNYLLIIIAAIILLIFFATGGLFLGKVIYSPKKSSVPIEIVASSPTASPSPLLTETIGPTLSPTIVLIPNPTADWKSYTHPEDISFKYPSLFKEQYANPLRTGLGTFNQFLNEDGIYTLTFSSVPNFQDFAGGKPKYSNLEDISKENSEHTAQQFNIDSHPAIKILPYTTNLGSTSETVTSAVYFFTTNANNVNFVDSLTIEIKTSDQAKVRIGNEIFDQILTTLKFVK